MPNLTHTYVGRFAPSPTGPLHFGSLIGALASFLDAHAHGGRWLVRIEDIDPAREVPEAASVILDCLRAHGLAWDGDVMFQSERLDAYREACSRLLEKSRAFYCTCSRSDLLANRGVYTGHCRACQQQPNAPHAIRLLTEDRTIEFIDRIQGKIRENIGRAVGDFVIYRKEQVPAYQLAVVLDDAEQQITHIVRGSDLLESTARQIYLQQCLKLSTPSYAHVPVISNVQGHKLSKQTFAAALDNQNARDNLLAALDFLDQKPVQHTAPTIDALLQSAIAHWDIARIPKQVSLSGTALPQSCHRFAT